MGQAITPELEEKFSVVKLNALPYKTPFLYMDLDTVEAAYQRFRHLLPEVRVHYAMKCNPEPQVLTRLHKAGCSFEIASYSELAQLARIGVVASEVIFSNPVKVPGDIRRAYRAGLRRFAFDSRAELDKIAENAPGSAVYVRMATREADSDVPSEGKFGIDAAQAHNLMQYARLLGLEPYGIAFHVGSQMREAAAWDRAISDAGGLMKELAASDIRIQMLDMGGGFPAHHGEVPDLEVFAAQIKQSLKKLPYAPKELVIEPGRALVGDAGVMVATVIGTAERNGKRWVHLDVGAFNGMMEALETANQLIFPVTDSRHSSRKDSFALTGPSCDSQDTIMFDVKLSSNIAVGDRLFLHVAGAYTTAYASRFNGFDIPKTYCA